MNTLAPEIADRNSLILWKFHWYCGRMGDVEGVFTSTPADLEKLIGLEVYFGEILGKHSEISGTLDFEDLTVLSNDIAFAEKFKELIGSTGYDPREYMEEE